MSKCLNFFSYHFARKREGSVISLLQAIRLCIFSAYIENPTIGSTASNRNANLGFSIGPLASRPIVSVETRSMANADKIII